MNATINKKKIGKSALSLILVMLMLFSVIPFSAGATTTPTAGTTGNTASPYPLPGNTNDDYPAANDPEGGYVQLTKSAAWLKDPNTLDGTKKQGYITLNTYGTPVGGGGIDVILVMDGTGSMSGTNNTVMKQAARLFVEKTFAPVAGTTNNNRIAILPFTADVAYLNNTGAGYTDFTTASDAGIKLLTGEGTNYGQVGKVPVSGSTYFERAFKEALTMFQNDKNSPNTEKIVLFMTDGDPSDKTNERGTGVLAAEALRNYGVTIYGLGMGIDNTPTASQYIRAVATSDDLVYCSKVATDFLTIYDDIAADLQAAATAVTITDYLNTDYFAIDTSRPFYLDGAKISAGNGGVTITEGSTQKIVWELDTISSTGNELMIPIKFLTNDEGVFYTNKDRGDNARVADRAMIEYTNFKIHQCRKAVESPALARPNAGIQVIYYEVDAAGKPMDDSGSTATITNKTEFEARYHSLGGYTASQLKATTHNYKADPSIKAANGTFYKLVKGAQYASNDQDNINVTPDSNDDFIQVWFGYTKVDGASLELNKKYEPALPSGTADSSFIFTNTADGKSQLWVAGTASTIILAPDDVYDVTETAAQGYKTIPTFQIKFDGTSIQFVGTKPANVEINGTSITFTNEKDDGQKENKVYFVDYYFNGKKDASIQDRKTITKNVWVGARVLDIDPITDFFPGYKLEKTVPGIPGTIPVNDVVSAYYVTDDSQKVTKSYKVQYYFNNVHDSKKDKTIEKDVQLLATEIEADAIKDSFSGYKLEKTDPATLPKMVAFDSTVKAYYVTDSTQTEKKSYKVQYYFDGKHDVTKNKTVEKDVQLLDTKIEADPITDKFTGYKMHETNPKTLPALVDFDSTVHAYYVKDNSQTEKKSYNVEYYFDDVHDKSKDDTVTKDVYVLDTQILADSISDFFPGYRLKSTSPATLPTLVDFDSTVKAYYVTDGNQTTQKSYDVEYYFNDVHDTSKDKTVTKNAHVLATTIPADAIVDTFKGYKLKETVPTVPSDVPVGSTVKAYYITDSDATKNVAYKVEYYFNDKLDTTKNRTVTKTVQELATQVEADKITDTFAGYKLDKTSPAALPSMVDFNSTVKAYYVTDSSQTKTITYKVEYYLSDAPTPDEVVPVETKNVQQLETTVDVQPFKNFPGYVISRTDPTNPKKAADGDVIRVYLKPDDTSLVPVKFTIKYQDDMGVKLEEDTVVTQQAWSGNPVATARATDLEWIPGKKLLHIKDSVTGDIVKFPMKNVPDGTVFIATYVEDPSQIEDASFKIEYYKAGNNTTTADAFETKNVTIISGQTYGLKEIEVTRDKFPGEKIDTSKTDPFPIQVGNGGVAKIYFMKDPSQFKSIQYTVKHMVDGVEMDTDIVTVSDVPITSSSAAVQPVTARTYAGYKATPTVSPAVGTMIADGGTVRAVYEKDPTDMKTVSYTVKFYTADWQTMNDYSYAGTMYDIPVTKSVWAGATSVDVDLLTDAALNLSLGSATTRNMNSKDYAFNATRSTIPGSIADGGEISLYYVEDANIDVQIEATTTYTKMLQGNDFEFGIFAAGSSTLIAVGENDASGKINFKLTVPLSIDTIGSINEYEIKWTQNVATNSKKPDKTVFTVKMKTVMNSDGAATLQLDSYDKSIRFAMR